jgi:hypothetical protein
MTHGILKPKSTFPPKFTRYGSQQHCRQLNLVHFVSVQVDFIHCFCEQIKSNVHCSSIPKVPPEVEKTKSPSISQYHRESFEHVEIERHVYDRQCK